MAACLHEPRRHLFSSLRTPAESLALAHWLRWFGVALTMILLGSVARARNWLWSIGTHLVVASCAVVFLLLYLLLPMQIGLWWYVYPREITSAAIVALALLPRLPKLPLARAACVAALCLATLPLSHTMVTANRDFNRATAGFERIVEHIPQAPRLLYLVFDHSGSQMANTPFIHLPAYVQAMRGGWLSFHFAMWGASPVVYRPGGDVPPKVPLRWEWTPHRFRVLRHGRYFNWFLVRSARNPDSKFRGDPSITRVARDGRWWLYRRHGTRPARPAR